MAKTGPQGFVPYDDPLGFFIAEAARQGLFHVPNDIMVPRQRASKDAQTKITATESKGHDGLNIEMIANPRATTIKTLLVVSVNEASGIADTVTPAA